MGGAGGTDTMGGMGGMAGTGGMPGTGGTSGVGDLVGQLSAGVSGGNTILSGAIYTFVTGAAKVGTDSDWKYASAGLNHHCAVKPSGTLYCWGINNQGSLGDGTMMARATPTQIGAAGGWSAAAPPGTGWETTCAIKADATLWCWGRNSHGQLGIGTQLESFATPQQTMGGSGWQSVTVGDTHACGVKTDGTGWCWGANQAGQVGNLNGNQPTPTQVGTDTNWRWMSAGVNHSCGLKADGSAYCWGHNQDGQLGDGSQTTMSEKPVRVGTDNDWAFIAAMNRATIALKTSGTIWTWGANQLGEGGIGKNLPGTRTPGQVGTATDWTMVSGFMKTACARNRANAIFCWGQRGTTNTHLPTMVTFP